MHRERGGDTVTAPFFMSSNEFSFRLCIVFVTFNLRFGFVSFLSCFVFTNAFQTRILQNRFRAKPIAQTFTNHYLLKTVFINVLFSNNQ